MSNSNNSNTNMIKSIDKIKHQILDINTPVMCKKYNLIFGYNGTGKTTLSKIFKEIETSKQLEQSHYRIISDDQTPYIRVFYGEDYIKDNIVGDNIDPIIFSIGEEFAEKKKKKEELVNKLSKLGRITAEIGKKQSAIRREKDTLLSENAKNIKDRYSIPNYTKLTLMRDITTLQPEIDVCLSLDAEKLNSEIQKNLAIFSNKQNMRTIEKVNIPIAFINKEAYQKFIQELSVLLIKPQNAENIFTQIKYEYENENSDFQSFIQYGIKHTKFVKEKKCPFCFNELGSLFDSFLEYFNDNVRKHQDKLVLLEDKFSSFFQKRELIITKLPTIQSFFPDMRDDVMQHITSLNEQNKIIAHIENNFTGCLLQKKHNPYTEIDYSAISHMEYLDAVQSFEAMLQSLYKIVEEHNRRVSQFEKIRNNAKNMLIALEISQFFDKNKNYANSETFYHLRLSKLTPSHNIYEKQIEKLDEELLDFKAPI